jgi:crotonobetainyl-CoA:carnitine CoA-transferase CaiB-like acyl-CoA transferase
VVEAMADPQIAHREALAEVRDAGGVFKVLNPPFRMSAADTSVRARTPRLSANIRALCCAMPDWMTLKSIV